MHSLMPAHMYMYIQYKLYVENLIFYFPFLPLHTMKASATVIATVYCTVVCCLVCDFKGTWEDNVVV